nr:thiolase domain-containing protein [Candidatus Njordarchaeum guaymaensis]
MAKGEKKVAIVGVGQSKFGRRMDASYRELCFEATKQAFEDSGLTPKDIQYSVIGVAGAEFLVGQLAPAAPAADYVGLNPQGSMRVEAACATGSAAVRTAYTTLLSGLADVVMVLGFEKMNEVPTGRAVEALGRGGDAQWEFAWWGTTFPAFYALMATRHMNQFGTTEEQLAKVAVKSHKYGAMNPYAHMQKAVTLDEVMKSRVIAWPLKLYDCSLITDGAAAVIMASASMARKISDAPIWITGLGCASEGEYFAAKPSYVGVTSAVEAGKQAFKMAKVEPKDIDVADVHDCFTIAEIMALEDLGFCKKGEGGKFVDEEQTYVGGKLPTNVDGGLKSKGHPIGATGVSMAAEIAKQLRGEADAGRQVPKAEIGLTHNVGATGQYAYVHIYTR